MATLIGTSGALEAVRWESALRDCSFEGSTLEGLQRLRTQRRAKLAFAEAYYRKKYRGDIEAKRIELVAAQQAAATEIALLRQDLGTDLEAPGPTLATIRQALILRSTTLLERLRCWRKRCRYQGRTRSLDQALLVKEEQLQRLERDLEANVAFAVQEERESFEAADGVLAGASAAGARAELAVIGRLATLPDEYSVINDVRLDAAHFLRFRGTPLMSAQIDHVVVGPCGVFVIETKNWSEAFVRAGDFLNPFEQVGRARLLCHIHLKDHGLPNKVRSILVTTGASPPKTERDYTAVLQIEHLCQHILRFKPALLKEDMLAVGDYFERVALK